MNPQADANAIYNPALQAINAQTPQIQQLYQTLVQGLQQQSMAQQQNVVTSAQQRGLTAPTLGTQVAGAYGQDLNLINAQLMAQKGQTVAGIGQEAGKANVGRANAVNELSQSLLKQNMENQQNQYQMTDIERKAQLEQQQNQQQFDIQKARYETAQREAAARAAQAAREAASSLSTKDFESRVEATLLAVRGGDGKVSPSDYVEMKQLWADNGLSPAAFDKKFDGFVNLSHSQQYYNPLPAGAGAALGQQIGQSARNIFRR